MAQFELVMPKMGESIMEATILKWLKNEGDPIEAEESVLEIATDKVDSEVPSPVEGTLLKRLYNEGDVVEVGKPIALIEVAGDNTGDSSNDQTTAVQDTTPVSTGSNGNYNAPSPQPQVQVQIQNAATTLNKASANGNRFYSPLVLNIARQEGIDFNELERIAGTGKNARVTKKDMLAYVKQRSNGVSTAPTPQVQVQIQTPPPPAVPQSIAPSAKITAPPITYDGDNVEIIEMDRMRRMIADHMVMSKNVSPHVTSFTEVDMTDIVNWRNKIKTGFQQKEGQKITFTPIFVEAITKAISDYPRINSSVDGYKVIVRKNINIGMATALPSGNLIVPVIKDANHLNLIGLTKKVNDLANRARNNKLKADEVQGGTFTLTNVGGFGSLMGTPIINQPQVAILAVGIIRKMPAVMETEYGDVIAIRQKMIMSLSYDHRVVDGALGSTFLNRVKHYLETFDTSAEW